MSDLIETDEAVAQDGASHGGGARLALGRAVVPLYAATLFLSALLLFWIQPLVAKLLLPLLGGAPAVWNTAMMFFQLILLAGYGYAHLVGRHVPERRQGWIHVAVLTAALFFLPVAAGDAVPEAGTGTAATVAWLLARLLVLVGAPFFALSATAPLLQSWFARSGDKSAADPYFLYAASNLGSLVALVAFPLVLEPSLSLSTQSRVWALLFLALVALIAVCAMMAQSGEAAPLIAKLADRAVAGPRWRERAIWIGLAFAPSSLLLGVTSFIATDVASAPLLWIVPLALYLLSFIVTFAHRPLIGLDGARRGQAATMSVLLFLFMLPQPPLTAVVPAHYATFFLTALVCHGALAARRPAVSRLTEFYFCMSLGGALGGVFNALVAPVVFSSTYEYPMALVLGCLLRGAGEAVRPPSPRSLFAPLAIVSAVFLAIHSWDVLATAGNAVLCAVLLIIVLCVLAVSGKSLRYALAVAAVLGPASVVRSTNGVLDQERSFFGVHRVKRDNEAPLLQLAHGTTVHGAEFIDSAHWREQVKYYAQPGPIGQFFDGLRAAESVPLRVAVIGLGTGALSCYSRDGEPWTFYEIDPVVERLARDTRYFHYLEQCGGSTRVVLGDARLSLKEASEHYDLLVLDAFSSDAIPIHLLTREAIDLYLAHLSERGVVLLHVSNRHLELTPILAAAAGEAGLVSRHQLFLPSPAERAALATGSEWVAIARRAEDLAFLDAEPRWAPLPPYRNVAVWTDDFSNIIGAFKW
jgi:hypothetical protein